MEGEWQAKPESEDLDEPEPEVPHEQELLTKPEPEKEEEKKAEGKSAFLGRRVRTTMAMILIC